MHIYVHIFCNERIVQEKMTELPKNNLYLSMQFSEDILMSILETFTIQLNNSEG